MLAAVRIAALAALLAIVAAFPPLAPAAQKAPPAQPTAVGTGGAVATVDPYASEIAVDVLRKGGNAIDAAVAAAAALGVVEPYSCGIGGGGFMVIRTADGRLTTIDSREKAPAAFRPDSFIDPRTNEPIPFAEAATSGLSVGVPGTVRGWELALERFGTMPLKHLLQPSIALARGGFVVDETFEAQTDANLARFRDFTSTAETFLEEDGTAPDAGDVFRNRDLADTYQAIAKNGGDALYAGQLAREIVATVKRPPVRRKARRNVRPGLMETGDLRAYDAVVRPPASVDYRGLQVVGMGPPSSGGSTIGEALNILEGFDLAGASRELALHRYLDASRLSFADRGAYLGDSDFVYVPLRGLLSDGFAAERRGLMGDAAVKHPAAPGDPYPYDGGGSKASATARGSAREGRSTTHLTVVDAQNNVVSYTFTIEQTGGSGIVVPDRGFLLNNELTDFEFVPGRANSPAPGKRPRSSMSPTIVLRDGRPLLALGSPGGSTIITTVLQMLVNRFDLGMTLPEALAAPRLTQRNTPATLAEPAFLGTPERGALEGRGHSFSATAEIGAATAVEVLPDGRRVAAAEPTRRGGGSAMVERPD